MVAVSNAPERGIARDEPGKSAAEAAPISRKRRWFGRKQHGELRIYQHSNLLYWWPIWAYGYPLCGSDVRAGDRREGAGSNR